MKLCVETISSSTAAMPYLQDIPRIVSQTLCMLFEHCLSSTSRSFSTEKRISSATQVFELGCQFAQNSGSALPVGNFGYRILQCRLEVPGSTAHWVNTDAALARVFTLPYAVLPAREDIDVIIDFVNARDWQSESPSYKVRFRLWIIPQNPTFT